MNSISDGSKHLGNPRQRLCKQLARFSGLIGLGLFVLAAALPNAALAANHGAGIFKNPLGPPPLLQPFAHTGDTITASIRVRNLDGFGDSLTITSIVDVVFHGPPVGVVTSANLLPAPIVLTNFNDFKDVIHTYTLLATDANLTNLLDNAIAGGIDNHDGSGGTHFAQPFQITFPGQIQIIIPCIQVTKSCAVVTNGSGLITYVGSVSNCGNTLLSPVWVSNFVNGGFVYVLGPTNLDVNQVITFTNSYMPLNPCQPATDTLFAIGTDELTSNVVSSATATCSTVSTNPPVLMCQPNKTVECGTNWTFDPPIVMANGGGTNAASVTVFSTVTNALCGVTFKATRTWLASNDCSSIATCTQMVTVVDTTPPAITCAPNRTVECGVTWGFEPPTAMDGCNGTNVTIAVTSTVTNALCGKTFRAIRTWSATDPCGNSNTCSQAITIVDTTAPNLVCGAAKTVECGTTWSFATPSATDICDGILTNFVVTTITNRTCGNTFIATRTWTATDSCSNNASCSQTVTVLDRTPPHLTCSPNLMVECGTTWNFMPPIATDLCDGTITNFVVTTTTNRAGFCGNTFTATRTWTVTDSCSNSATCSQTVTIMDTTPPELTCGKDQTVECGTTWGFAMPSVFDDCDGTNVTLTILSTVTNSAGSCGNTFSAMRTWQATDHCTNISTCSQIITVIDTTPPQITCGSNQVVECGTAWNFAQPSAFDACAGTNVTVSILSTVTNAGACPNTFSATRTWRAADQCTNSSTCSQTITVMDTTPPHLTCASNLVVECGTAWNFTQPGASDACAGTNVSVTILSTVTNAGACPNTFSATRTWRATDPCTNISTCSQTVTVMDTTPPQLTCGSNLVVECGTAWSFTAPSAFDICAGTNVNITILSTVTNAGSCANTFSATRTWRAADPCTNATTCSQTVTVIDTTPPQITCGSNQVVECGTVWNFAQPSVFDACAGTNVTVTILGTVTNAGACPNTFSATRSWRAADPCTNSSTCSQTITVIDTTPPQITCGSNQVVECGTAWNFAQPSVFDACAGTNVTVSILSTVTNAGACPNTFSATRTWRAADPCTNNSTCSQTITVIDTTPPQITCGSNQVVECGTAWNFAQPNAFDACAGTNVTVTILSTVTNAGACPSTFSATRIWRASDPCTNSSTCSQTITVIDTTPPQITCGSNQVVECGTSWSFAQPNVFDACAGTNVTLTILSTVTNAGPCSNTFSATRIWRATDLCTNISTCSQTITVVDTTAPNLTCSPNLVVECGTAWNFVPPNAFDACAGSNVTVTIVSTVTNAGSCSNTFTATRTWRAADSCTNSSMCSQTVTVIDTTPPLLFCGSNQVVECGTTWNFGIPTASDLCAGTNVTVTVVSTVTNVSSVCSNDFSATRTWRATDPCSNSTTFTQTITVIDTTPPQLVCGSNQVVECGSVWNFAAPSAFDICAGTNVTITILSTVTNANSGCSNSFSATRTWRASDPCTNSSTCSQTITVIDTTPPQLVCGSNQVVECGTAWNFAQPSVFDACAGTNVTLTIVSTVTNSAGSCSNTFSATRTWRATDSCTNSSMCSQTITVIDTTPPVLSCPPNLVIECGTGWTFVPPTAFDACAGTNVTLTIVSTVTNATGCSNTFVATRMWRASDQCTNSSTCSQTVTVVDTTPPNLSCPPNLVIECGTGWTFVAPTVFDACAGTNVSLVIVSTVTNAGGCSNTFTATRTWRATDQCTNSSMCSQMVTVIDTTPPDLVCGGSQVVECGTTWTFAQPSAYDICAGTNVTITVLSTVTNATGCSNTFSATRMWRATDQCANSAICSQTITVIDTTPPDLVCATNQVVECGTAWNFTPPRAFDICAGSNVTLTIVSTVTNSAGSCSNTFSATRMWRATDQCTNSSTCSQTITVIDTTPPQLTCGSNQVVECGTAWNFAQPSVFDACAGTNVTVTIVSTVTNNAGSCSNTFSATRMWRATDQCTNSSTCSQTITVIDTTPPNLVCASNLVVECGTAWNFTAPSAFDACAGTNVTITLLSTVTNSAGSCSNTFSATRMWRATDQCTNSSTCSQTVTVIDTTPPQITCGSNQVVECGTAWNFAAPNAFDICAGTNVTITILSTVTNANGSCSNTFSATRTWRATDPCTNSSMCSQTITVIDTTPPNLVCGSNLVVECGTAWNFTAPSAFDACAGTNVTITVLTTVTNLSAGCSNNFSATRTWRATDPCTNSSTCSQTVTVMDTTPPQMTCGSNLVVECGTAWNFTQPSVSDACAGTNVILTIVSTVTNSAGSCSNTFSATRTWRATDPCTNSSTCSQTIIVIDTTPPQITCGSNQVVECGTAWNFAQPSVFDACAGTNVTLTIVSTVTNSAGSCSNTFSATRMWRATDQCTNISTCSQTITVIDTTPPQLVCGSNQVVECGTAWAFAAPSAFDICAGTNVTITIVSTLTNANASCSNAFSATRTWRATDPCTNSSMCSQTITVIDTTPPQLTCASNLVVECGTAWNFTRPSASDACAGTNVTITIVSTVTNAGACPNTFSATRTWRATDPCTNSSTCSQTITVIDTTPPQLTCGSNQVVECGTAWNFAQPSAFDACAGTNVIVSILSTVTNAGLCPNTFSATRTWRAADPCTNSSMCSQTITVIDTTPPQLTCGSNQVVECGTAWNFAQPSVFDACAGTNVTLTIVSTETNRADSCSNTFRATRTWRATNQCTNSSMCSQTITVIDTTPPQITCGSNQVVECGTVWNFAQPSAFDACAGSNVTVSILSTVTNAGACPNTFSATRTWRAADQCTNSSMCSQTITVIDTTPPQLTCGSNQVVECGTTWNFAQPNVFDACAGTNVTVTILSTVTNAGACPKTFSATRTWRAADPCTNSSMCSQTITVIDTTPPQITCGSNQVVECGTAWSFAQPNSFDACAGTNVTITILSTVTNAGSCANTFSATRTWRAADQCTNSSMCSQTITVIDTTPPNLVCASNLVVECGTVWNFTRPGAFDACAGTNVTITILSTTTNRTGFCGNTFSATRTWRAADFCTNTSTCSQTITVVDTTPPNLTCAPDLTVECGTGWDFKAPTVFDACDGTNVPVVIVTTTTNRAGFCGNTFSATRTWSATDACTNSSACSQTITVVDITPPVLTGVPGSASYQCLSEVPPLPQVTATNNCDPNPTITLLSLTNGTCPLYITNIWTAIDACSNSSMAVQVIRVQDTIPPLLVGVPANQTNACLRDVLPPPPVTAIDNCDTNVVVTLISTTNGFRPTLIVNCWTAVDHCTNTTRACQTNIVLDTPAAIGDFVWEDTNHNGIQDAGEPGIPNVTVQLLDCSNNLLATTTTDGGGLYLFTNLLCGSYVVQFVNPDTNLYQFTLPYQGVDTALDSDANQITGKSACIPLAGGETNLTIDAGLIPIRCNLAVTKTACVLDLPGAGTNCLTTFSDAGCVRVKYTYIISNPGPAPANNITVIDDQLGPVPGSPIATLLPGQFVTLMATNNSVCCSSTNTVTVKANNGQCHAMASASVTVQTCTPLSVCTPPYPFASTNPLTSVVFNESEVLRTNTVLVSDGGCVPQQIRAFYNDEHALTMGVRQVVVKNSGGTTTTTYPVTPLPASPGSALNPQVGATALTGDQAGTDFSGRPLYPALFITDITSNPNSLAGDWQFGGTAIPPHAVFGTWKAAVRTVDNTHTPAVVTIQPDADPAQNHYNLGGGDPAPAGLVDQGYGAEIRWNVAQLGLLPGHAYRLYFMVHDGDQNKTGGDVGQACAVLNSGSAGNCVPCQLAVTENACVLDVPGAETNCVTTFSASDCVRVKYTYIISNTGSSRATNVMVIDSQFGELPGSPIASLPPGQSVTLSVTNNSVCCSSTNNVTVNAGGQCQAMASASITVTKCNPLLSCTVPYPFASSNALTSVVFNESEVLRAFNVSVSNGCAPQQIQAFFNDEHALTLGARQVVVKTAGGSTTNNFPITALPSDPGSAVNPQVGSTNLTGDFAGTDLSGRPLFPALFITDITADPSSLAGDWQFGGTAIPPHAIFGTWKGAVRTVDKTQSPPLVTVQPDTDPVKNDWNLGASDPVPAGLVDQGYGAEVRWDVAKLGLLPGHTYRLYFMVHDGDQNKAGGDVGHACAILNAGRPGICAPSSALGDFVWQDLNTNGLQDAGEPGVSGVAVHLLDCAGNPVRTAATGPDGSYLFTGLAAGSYKVQFVPPAGFSFTTQNAGDSMRDSDADPATGLTICYALGVGQTNLSVDAGLVTGAQPLLAISPRIYWPEFLANGRVQLRTDGALGASYRIEGSADLVRWSPVTTLVNQAGVLDFIDPAAVNAPQRFYRVVILP